MNQPSQKYICPMHPEIFSDQPGRCSKCGMALIAFDGKLKSAARGNEDKGLGVITWRSYMPLIVIILLIAVISVVVFWNE